MSEINDDYEPAFPDLGTAGERPGLSLRQYAAIHLQVPDSGLPWLDAMIDRARRDRFAGKAMAGLLASPNLSTDSSLTVTRDAVVLADALIAKLGGE